ncbi:MAG: NADH-quinone oxidoreductase subunit A [Planctomycetaceae bacterium]
MHPVLIAGFVALFVAIGGAFLCVNLLVGWLVRPREPNAEKLEVYECGEPTIGSSFVQFDLRFYVVALLFIIFDVEVALFFPWATVFGKATQLADPTLVAATADGTPSAAAAGLLRELGLSGAETPRLAAEVSKEKQAFVRDAVARHVAATAAQADAQWDTEQTGRTLAGVAVVDMAAFFAVLLMGFAYVWYRGDLDWVRAVAAERTPAR